MKSYLIIGATSAIAQATSRILAQRGDKVYLIARDQERLAILCDDLKVRGASLVEASQLDVNRTDLHQSAIEAGFVALGKVDAVLIAHGTLPDQKKCEQDFDYALDELNTNTLSTISLLTHIANKMEQQQSGTIAVITSVAGDRGRQSNYVYGAAKGMLSIFLQGLRNRLHSCGVSVVDIKPGFVDTPMTAQFKKGLLWAQPKDIAMGIVKGMDKGKRTLYLPFFWRYIMLIIKLIPEPVFVRLKL